MYYFLNADGDCEAHHIVKDKKNYLGQGSEGVCYRYQTYAVKIYHPKYQPGDNVLSEDDCYYFTELTTESILLPKYVLADEHKKYCGYVLMFNEDSSLSLFEDKTEHTFQALSNLDSEIAYLTDHWIKLGDWYKKNTQYRDGVLYVIDPGGYFAGWSDSDKFIRNNNMWEKENLLMDFIEDEFRILGYSSADRKELLKIIKKQIALKTCESFLEKEARTYSCVSEFLQDFSKTYKKKS